MKAELEKVIRQIGPLDRIAMQKCQTRLDNLTKPLGSLHAFEHLACKMAGITSQARPRFTEPVLFLVNGGKRTPGMTDVFAVNISARLMVLKVDDVSRNNDNVVWQALLQGIKTAAEVAAGGVTLIGIGMTGELQQDLLPSDTGANLPSVAGMEWLLHLGEPKLAALVGLILGAAAGRAAVALDGAATMRAAEIAISLAPEVSDYLVCSHLAAETEFVEGLKRTGLPAYLYLGMNVGEGTGAALGISLIQAALHVVNDMKTFGEAQVSVAEDGPGALVQDINIRD